jgi:hypothetical protein
VGMNDVVHRYCRDCDELHPALVVSRDVDGFALRWRWVTAHTSPSSRVLELRDRLGEDAGRAMAIGLDSGQWEMVEEAADALSVNDPPEERP